MKYKTLILTLIVIIPTFACISSSLFVQKRKFSIQIYPEPAPAGSVILFVLNSPGKNEYTLKLFTPEENIYYFAGDEERLFTLCAVPLNAPDRILYVLKRNNITIKSNFLSVYYPERKISYLHVDKKYIAPSRKLRERLWKEHLLIKKAKTRYTKEKLFTGAPVYPVTNKIITSPFGHKRIFNGKRIRYHYGTDWAGEEGDKVFAVYDGIVILTGDFYYSGNTIFIDSGLGLIFMYAHLSKIFVKEGDKIKKGEVIGLVGKTGRVTGPHLHLGLFIHGIPVDPVSLFKISKFIFNSDFYL